MDPNNLPSKSSSYVGLLHSQQESQPFPAFSSQQSQDAPLEPPVQTPAARGVRRKWNPADDELTSSILAAERQMSSGETETDVLKKAHDIFFSDQEHKFTLEHAWCVLRYEQKWLSLNTPTAGGVSKRKNVEINSQTSTNEGVKAAKAKRNSAELSLERSSQVHYPPQPEVEFGFPQVCYCGAKPLLATSNNRQYQGRRYYTCAKKDDGECHVYKWWDEALMEEMRARDIHVLQLGEKEWKNCPTAWKGMYSRGTGKPTIVLEAVASYDLWIWHAFFGAPEAVRKDVERAFGVLQARFSVVRNPSNIWDKEKIGNIMRACIILHNMIVEDERSSGTEDNVHEFEKREEVTTFSVNMPSPIVSTIDRRTSVRNRQVYQQ
uniref:GRF-type domain-containing protein n=1 Tax=Brassica oleracea var. oleracea TaxID=109376 RepID=A0A0D3BHD3_BRAOL